MAGRRLSLLLARAENQARVLGLADCTQEQGRWWHMTCHLPTSYLRGLGAQLGLTTQHTIVAVSLEQQTEGKGLGTRKTHSTYSKVQKRTHCRQTPSYAVRAPALSTLCLASLGFAIEQPARRLYKQPPAPTRCPSFSRAPK